jgi:phage FluMu gp28-like protein
LRLPVLIKNTLNKMQKWSLLMLTLVNNAVDGLMYIRIADIPESTMKPVMEEFQAELERKSADKEITNLHCFQNLNFK